MLKKTALFAVIALSASPLCAKNYVEKLFLSAARGNNVKEITNTIKDIVNPEILDKGLKKAAKRGFSKVCSIISPKATVSGNDLALKKGAKRGFKNVCAIILPQASTAGCNKGLKHAAKRGFKEVCKIISPFADTLGRAQARVKLLKLFTPDTIENERLLPEGYNVASAA